MTLPVETYLQIPLGASKDREIRLLTALLGVVEALYCPENLTREQALELVRVADYVQARLVADANKALSKL